MADGGTEIKIQIIAAGNYFFTDGGTETQIAETINGLK